MNTTRTRRAAVGLALGAAMVTGTAGAANAAPLHDGQRAPQQRVDRDRPADAAVKKASVAREVRGNGPVKRAVTHRTATRVTTGTATSTGTSSSTRTSSGTATSSSTAVTTSAQAVTMSSTTSISTAGLSANAVKVLQAINGTYPQITTIGGIRSGADAQDHATGHALDLMLDNHTSAQSRALGQEIADYLVAHHRELGVHYVIHDQKIWNVQRASEGWRVMSDRGSDTANHRDHVHVSVY